MPDVIPPYPKVWHIGERYIQGLFDGQVEVTEKIDGSQFGFGLSKENEMALRSKGVDLTHQFVQKMFEKAADEVKRMEPMLREREWRDIYFYVEFLESPKHNVLKYDRIPKNHFYLFGVMKQGEFVRDINTIWWYADELGIERPNLLHLGIIKDIKELEHLLEAESILGGEKVEGIVVKNYNMPVIIGGRVLPVSIGKFVREGFKERLVKDWKGHTTKGTLESFIDSFRSEARWQKAVQHLQERGELEGAPRDIALLIPEVKRDLFEEEGENIKEELFVLIHESIVRRAVSGLPEWYKAKLLEGAFEK